ncbi:MAG TPA: PilN domain-containing protein [Rhodanobacteraceae bacterium]|nr:PilN domain-containing protein [Rhodanobacteraceae bacterium]
MARINLLPWRAERRKQREREFYGLLGTSAVAAILVLFIWVAWMNARIDNQDARNAYLTDEIKTLDQQIAEIAELDKTRARLLTRKQIIEQLQSNRSQMVHLFDEMVKTIPDGARLTAMKQTGDTLTLAGVAESNARVANYMRHIDASPWMGRSDLQKIENMSDKKGADKKMPYVFSLDVKLRKPEDAAEDGNAAAAAGATVPAATATPVSAKPSAATPASASPPAAPPPGAPTTTGGHKP